MVNGKSVGDVMMIFDDIKLPKSISLTAKDADNNEVAFDGNSLTIVKENTHTICLGVPEGENLSLDVDTFTVQMSDNSEGNKAMQITNVVKHADMNKCSFDIIPTIQAADVTGNVIVKVTFNSEYEAAKNGITLNIPVTVKTISIKDFELRQIIGMDENGNELLSENPVVSPLCLYNVGTTEYRVCPIAVNTDEICNVAIDKVEILNIPSFGLSLTEMEVDENDSTKIVVRIDSNKNNR